jgi:spoIIIJ-associated protein
VRSVEGEGGTIDEAITRALAALGVARDRVEIDILENATPGVLGFGRKRARVRATIRTPLAAWGAAAEETPAVAQRPERASEMPPSTEAFDGVELMTEVLRRMEWRAGVRASTHGDTRTLEIESADPAVIDACNEEVLRAFAFLVNRIAERQVRDGRRFVVALAARPAGGRGAVAPARSAERARSRGRERRGGGKPRR